MNRSLYQEDLLTGNNDWQNIQEIVRITFKQMLASLQSQERSIQNLERQLSLKASRSEVQSLITHKLDSDEFHSEANSLRSLIQSIRSDTSDLVCANREDYVNDYRKIISELDTKANKIDLKNQIAEIDYQTNLKTQEIKEIRQEFDNKIQVLKNQISIDIDYSREMNMIEFDKILENNKNIFNQIDENKNFSEEISSALLGNIKGIENDIDDIKKMHKKYEEDIKSTLSSSLNSVRYEVLEKISSLSDASNKLFRDFDIIKSTKIDTSHVHSLIQIKSEEISVLKDELSYMNIQLKSKTSYQEFEKELKNSKETLEILKKETNNKYDKKIHEIQTDLDTKKEALEETYNKIDKIQTELNAKLRIDDYNNFIVKQEAINETLCSENTIAKWSIENKRNLAKEVLWETQTVNTCPENFLWQKNSSEVIIVKSGFYEVSLGFYSEKKPLVQLYVNNQLVFSLVNCAS